MQVFLETLLSKIGLTGQRDYAKVGQLAGAYSIHILTLGRHGFQ